MQKIGEVVYEHDALWAKKQKHQSAATVFITHHS